MPSLTIIGAGLAGYNLARAWRARNATGALTIVAADSADFYSKPMLSNGLQQNKSAEQLRLKTRAAMAADLNATILADTRVLAIDRQAQHIVLPDTRLNYQQLVLAVGADPFTPPFPGADLPQVLRVNDLADYARFREQLTGARRVVLLGGGLIGCEFANDLTRIGLDVHLVDLAAWPLARLLPESAGRFLEQALAQKGVQCHWQTSVAEVTVQANGVKVQLSNGEHIDADLVLSAVGLRPRTQLAAAAGLSVKRGIVVDRYLRSEDNAIYALGDCAEVAGLLLPFVQPIMHASKALAATLSGIPTEVVYPAMPVLVKTPDCPTVVAPPLSSGDWQVTTTNAGLRALHYSDGMLSGFALLGDATSEKNQWAAQLAPWLAASVSV